MSITERAIDSLRLLRYTSAAAPGQALRLAPEGEDGMQVRIAAPEAGDQVLEDKEGPVLIIAAALGPRLEGLVFDQVSVPGEHGAQDEQRTAFTLRAPHADELGLADL